MRKLNSEIPVQVVLLNVFILQINKILKDVSIRDFQIKNCTNTGFLARPLRIMFPYYLVIDLLIIGQPAP